MRFMYQVYGIAPYSANGYQVVDNYPGTTLDKVANNAASLPTPGDILSFAISTKHPGVGHTAVVTAVSVNSRGNGSVTYMQENASANGWGSTTIAANVLGDSVTGWLHNPNSSPTPNPTPTTPNDPKTNIESATQVAAGVRLVGWAYDPNTTNAVEIDVYEGSCCANGRGAYMATVSRPDFGYKYPAWGNNHGYDITLSLATGQWTSKTYCLYAINQGAGGNTSMGCKTVTTNWNPIGNLEVARRAPGGVHLSGWALDFDTTNALETDVYEGTCCAAAIGAFTANNSRPDVGAAFPGSAFVDHDEDILCLRDQPGQREFEPSDRLSVGHRQP